jgi:micrococcal nuclease
MRYSGRFMKGNRVYEYQARLSRIIDADTIELDVDLGFRVSQRMIVRMWGIDAIERRHPKHKHAVEWLRFQLSGVSPLRIRTQKDKQEKYGRYLAEVFYSDDTLSINQQMIANGYAVAYEGGKR